MTSWIFINRSSSVAAETASCNRHNPTNQLALLVQMRVPSLLSHSETDPKGKIKIQHQEGTLLPHCGAQLPLLKSVMACNVTSAKLVVQSQKCKNNLKFSKTQFT